MPHPKTIAVIKEIIRDSITLDDQESKASVEVIENVRKITFCFILKLFSKL